MSRPLRIEYEGACYHVTQRGHDKKAIYKQDSDYERFLLYLSLASRSYGIKIHAYCLMTNHYHLLIETPKVNLSKAMHAINTGYSVYYNKKHMRVGSLYQGRYNYCLVERDEYLHHVSRYIHLNPVRAKIVDKPEAYRWSSYRAYVSKVDAIEGLETGYILGMFGKSAKEAIKRYRQFVEDEIDVSGNILKKNTIRGLVIGGMEFFEEIKSKYIDPRSDAEIPRIKDVKTADDEAIRAKIEKSVGEG